MEKQEKIIEKTEGVKSAGEYGWLKIGLSRPLEFQNMKTEVLDLTGLVDLTLEDLNRIYDTYAALGGAGMVMQEATMRFAQLTAAAVTGLPIEMIGKLGAKDAIKLKNRVYRFFYR